MDAAEGIASYSVWLSWDNPFIIFSRVNSDLNNGRGGGLYLVVVTLPRAMVYNDAVETGGCYGPATASDPTCHGHGGCFEYVPDAETVERVRCGNLGCRTVTIHQEPGCRRWLRGVWSRAVVTDR